MKDKSIYIVLFLILILALIFTAIFIINNDLTKINEQLKKENYNLKIKIDKLEDEKLNLIVKYVEE